MIGEIIELCDNSTLGGPDDVQGLIDMLADSIGTMTMVNYPYATNFVNPLPAWPMTEACNAAKNPNENDTSDSNSTVSTFDSKHISMLMNAAKIFYNYNNTKECLDMTNDQSGGLDGNGWGVQTCNEFPMPMGDDPGFTW
jgi:lysosomal Pro-X carboxypeptidase